MNNLKTLIGEQLFDNKIMLDENYNSEKIQRLMVTNFYFNIEDDLQKLDTIINQLNTSVDCFDLDLTDPISTKINQEIIDMKNSLIFKCIEENYFLFMICSYFYLKNDINHQIGNFNLINNLKIFFNKH